MAVVGQKRTRSERVAALELPPGQWERAWADLRRRDVLARIALAALAAITMAAVIRAWDPPFPFRSGYTPLRDINARVAFSDEDPGATELARERARNQVRYVYVLDPRPLEQLRASLLNTIVALTAAETLKDFGADRWAEFQPPAGKEPEEEFQKFRAQFTGKEKLAQLEQALEIAFDPFEQRGMIDQLPKQHVKGNQEEIFVHRRGETKLWITRLSDVLVGNGAALHEGLLAQLKSPEQADRLFAWIRPQLAEANTLKVDETVDIRREMARAAAEVVPAEVQYEVGRTLAPAGQPLDAQKMRLLELEYRNAMAWCPLHERVARAAAVTVMIVGMFLLCGVHMRYRQRGPLPRFTRLSVILVLAVATVALACWASTDAWRAEIVPLLLFGMTMAIVYRQEISLLMSGVLALVIVWGIGAGMSGLLLLVGVLTTTNLNLGTIRSQTKLIYVGLFAAVVAIVLDVILSVIDNQPLDRHLLTSAMRSGLWVVTAGFLMTGLLPFIERAFGVLTDLRLLELGDVAHPLLQELVRRAPSTYNHSITVGSIAEAAAESIGARGLLVRVGAYFHDIGKMLKPGYFIENQGPDENRHESLLPAMSSLVIVAHIKDGADLARQHHLPQPIIDLIEQHHGTTRVGFFYERAAEQQRELDPTAGEVDESTYRYPGPKPQTKEAAVLMLADNVESASRTLVDPTPARIESLVRELAERRLHGGQFDESGLTLRELRTIERSLVKSLTAIYHGRLKYPEPKTA